MKIKPVLSLIFVMYFAFFIASPALAAKSYNADRYDVMVIIQPDGTLNITETIVFRFEGGPFTYIFRDLDFTKLDEIDSLQASMDGQALAEGKKAGQVEITTGRPLKVTWHFPPTNDAAHEFTLTYRVQGAIRQDVAADTLTWRAIPESHDYSIASSAIRIEYPSGVIPTSVPTLSGVPAELEIDDKGAAFTTQQVDVDTPVDISVSFPAGSLITRPPAWQSTQDERNNRTTQALPFGLGAAVLSSMLGLALIGLFGISFRREAAPDANAVQQFSYPPQMVPPALAARLVGSSTPFLGTLFDLAERGVLSIQEGSKKWGSRSFDVLRLSSDTSLRSHEQVFMEALFKKNQKERVALTDIGALSYNSKFTQALDRELTAAGLRDAQRVRRRNQFLALTGFGLILGIAIFFGGLLLGGLSLISSPWAIILGAILMGVGVGLSVAGLVGLLVAALISTRSDEGVRQASAWNSFAGYLRNIARGKEAVIALDIFSRYLPYAAGFGIATEWAKYFQGNANTPIPEWFQNLHSGIDDGSFVAVMAAISAADSSASASAGDGGGGASGGGTSGAG